LHSLFDSEIFKLLVLVKFTTLATLGLVDLSNDWIANALQFLHLLVKGVFVGVVVGVKPVFCFDQGVSNGALVILVQLVGELVLILNCVAHLEDVVLEGVLGIDLLLDGFVLVSELLGVSDHLLDFVRGEAALIVCDRDVLLFAGSLLDTANGQNGVLVDLESDFDLWNTSLGGWDA